MGTTERSDVSTAAQIQPLATVSYAEWALPALAYRIARVAELEAGWAATARSDCSQIGCPGPATRCRPRAPRLHLAARDTPYLLPSQHRPILHHSPAHVADALSIHPAVPIPATLTLYPHALNNVGRLSRQNSRKTSSFPHRQCYSL